MRLKAPYIFIIFITKQKLMNNQPDFQDSALKTLYDQQIEHQKKGEYKEAQQCKLKYEKRKNQLNKKFLADMNARHKSERDSLNKAKEDELGGFNNLYETQMANFDKKSQQLEQQMKNRHSQEIRKTKQELDKTLPLKVKQSTELLNLRKMEEHMAKQKNYNEAHKIQTKANKMFQAETEAWNLNRNNKIENSLSILRNKQNTELTNFQKRVKTTKAERNREKDIEVQKINMKYENLMKDLKVIQDREVLGFKGQFKSLGGTASSSPVKQRSMLNKN